MNDDAIIEIFVGMAATHACSVDDILETPELREHYLTETRCLMGDFSERDLLHRLVYLRKRSKLFWSRNAMAG